VMRMYGATRGLTTLLAAGVAGFLVWLSTQIDDRTTGGYWAVLGILAGAGLVMALSQLLGGWTKWGMPRLSAAVFLLAFVPTLVVVAWIAAAGQPHPGGAHGHVLNWSGDIGIGTLVRDLVDYVSVLAFGVGLVLGFSFDTAGPSIPPPPSVRSWSEPAATPVTKVDPAPEPVEEPAADETLVRG